MAKKHKQKKSKDAVVAMAVDVCSAQELSHLPQTEAMDTSEVSVAALKVTANHRGMKKVSAKRRAQRLRKEKALEKAFSVNEKKKEKLTKDQFKVERVQSMKKLY